MGEHRSTRQYQPQSSQVAKVLRPWRRVTLDRQEESVTHPAKASGTDVSANRTSMLIHAASVSGTW